MTEQWESDAEEFGRFVRGGSWQLGLLVARNVAPASEDAASA